MLVLPIYPSSKRKGNKTEKITCQKRKEVINIKQNLRKGQRVMTPYGIPGVVIEQNGVLCVKADDDKGTTIPFSEFKDDVVPEETKVSR
jgi:hypothetical protein